jgi:hypothetical protein
MIKYRRIRRHDKYTRLAGNAEGKGLTSRPSYRWEHNTFYKNGVGCCAMDATVSGQVVVVLKKTITCSDHIKIREFLQQLSDYNDRDSGC